MNDDTGNQPLTIQRRGLMLVLSSPSGAGKSTISRALLARHYDLTMSVSATTRPMRPGEVEGKAAVAMDRTQRKELLRKQLEVIREELDELDPVETDVATLEQRGATMVGPPVGARASGEVGEGRMAEAVTPRCSALARARPSTSSSCSSPTRRTNSWSVRPISARGSGMPTAHASMSP